MKRFLFFAWAMMMLTGCMKEDIDELRSQVQENTDRITALEDAVAALETRLESGAMIKSVTPVTGEPGGWRIEFTEGSPASIEILNGAAASAPDPGDNGVSPLIEVRTGAGGTVTLWYNITAGYPESGWTDTGVDLRGPQGPQGPQGTPGDDGGEGYPGYPGASAVSPQVRVADNGDGTVTIQYNITANYPESGWTNASAPIALDSNPRDKAAIFSIVENEATGAVTITMNDSDVPTDRTAFEFAKASGAVRFELVGFNDKIAIIEGETADIRFVVNPSDAWVPTGAANLDKWQLNQMDTRASYVTEPTDFRLVSVLRDYDKQGGQYIATIECLANDPTITDYAMSLVLNTGTDTKRSLVSSPAFVLGAKVPQTFTPMTWDDVQPIVDGMIDRDILDISGLTMYPDNTNSPVSRITKTITITEDITITAQMDPVLGQFGNGTPYGAFFNVHFELINNPTVTFDKVAFHESANTTTQLIFGDGNVIVKDASLIHCSPIDVNGDVTVYGTIAKLLHGNITHTTQISAQSNLFANVARPGISAHNVYLYGGGVFGGSSFDGSSFGRGSIGIATMEDVVIEGGFVTIDGLPRDKTVVFGGQGFNGNDGGDAIIAAGNVTVNGGGIAGGPSYGNYGTGGRGIVAGGDVTLSGERQVVDGGNWWSCYVRPGVGEYAPGIPFVFSGDTDTPARTLTAHTAMICGRDANTSISPPDGGYVAPWTMELQANDRAILDDCQIGWYNGIPLFSGGWYKITNPFRMWGTFDNATELP